MQFKKRQQVFGFTLLEMLLVMVIVSVIIYATIGYVQQRAENVRMDRTSQQMQQILNAGLSYYIDHGTWPEDITDLQGSYLPENLSLINPWGQSYNIFSYPAGGDKAQLFYVYTAITQATSSGSAAAAANTIAGLLPMGYTSSSSGSPPSGGTCSGNDNQCYVVGSVNIPGQNLNNARAVNFAGVYKHGGCVPVPTCPVDSKGDAMEPQVTLVPVSLSGVNNQGSNTTVYPISSFTAYVSGDPSTTPPPCSTGDAAAACTPIAGNAAALYWRACVQIVTEVGDVAKTRSDAWGNAVTLAAFTRCAAKDEPQGSTFNVYTH